MPLSPGTRLGAYEIVAQLGAGGMGEVYRARDPRLGREVAIKVLPRQFAEDTELVQRFEREARAVAALSHPNILTIYDFGRAEGISYAVMELLEGETVRVRLAHSGLAWPNAVEIAIAVADGLAAAHSRGIIHRDLKPENIFLTSDGRIKVLDFGLARWKPALPREDQSSAPTEVGKTEPGLLMGTTGYMSPEQVRGQPADAPSDVFSLGCILYEMVAGRRPFAGQTSAETMASVLRDEPPGLAGPGVEVPAELERLIAHCLEKNPEERFQSARDLAFDLRAVLASSVAGKGSSGRHRKAIESLAVLPLANASGDSDAEYLSDGITESIINSLSQLPDLRVMARSTVFRYKGRDIDPLTAGRELNVRAVLTGRLLHRGDRLVIKTELVDLEDGSQLWGEQYNRHLSDIFVVEEEISREISEKLRLRLTGEEKKRLGKRYTENAEAYQHYLRGRYYWNKRTAEGLKKGIDFFDRAVAKDPGYALALAGLADCYDVLGFYEVLAPRDAFPKAKAAAMRALEIDDTLGEALASLAYARHYYDWDWPQAESEYRRAIQLKPNYPTARHFFANYLVSMNRLDEALAESRRAEELDPLSLIINVAVGWVGYFARRYDEAISNLQKALDMDATFVPGRLFLAWAYEQKSMYREAIAELQKAVDLSGGGTMMLARLAHAHALSGDQREAARLLDGLRETSERRYVSSYSVAMIHAALGQNDAAFDLLEKALEERAHSLVFLQVDPAVDSLRSDPRFDDLLRRVGLTG